MIVFPKSRIIISIVKIHITTLKMISEQKAEKKHGLGVKNDNILTYD